MFQKKASWWRFYQKYKHRMRPAIVDNVIKMHSCGLTVRDYAVFQCINPKCTHQKKICFSCKSRFCPTCGKKLTDQWIEQQKAILPDTQWQHITFTMPSELWELFRYNRHLLGKPSALAAKVMMKLSGKKRVLPGIFTALHTFGRDLKCNVHVHLSITCGGLTDDKNTWKEIFFSKQVLMPMWRYEVINLLRQAFIRGELELPKSLKKAGASKTTFNRWLDTHYKKSWIVHFAKPSKNHHRNIKYLGRYLKRPALSMSRLKHYDGKEVIFSYLNHATKQYLRFTSGVEDFIKRLVQHIPDKGFRMIRYYGFLATRVRSKLLPKVYDLLDQPERKAIPIRFPALMKSSFGVDPLECILCKSRMVMTGIVTGKTMAELRQCHERLALNRPIILQ
nr:IS91 family transposase [Endozoicomonas montiporae]